MAVNTNNQKKNESVLGLARLPPTNSVLGLPSISPPAIDPNRSITRREGRIIEELHEDILITEGHALKAQYGMYQMGLVQECASGLFADTVGYMINNKNRVLGTEVEPYVTEFNTRQIHQYSRHMLGALEITGTRIGEQIHSSLDIPVEELGFWQRVLGGRR
jgi:hypothetical protein